MTLILTALCKNGISVCADKREKTRHRNGLSEVKNNLYKIHKFIKIPLIIYNHGVNKFNNKSWKTLCSDYESSVRWSNKNLEQISEDFKGFVDMDVKQQLESNLHNFPDDINLRTSFFNLSGKNIQNNRFEMYELFWSIDSAGQHFKSNSHRGFVRSGNGKECLDNYIVQDGEMNTIDYWENMDITQAKDVLIKLFSIAVEEKKRLGKDDFSDDFNIEFIKCS